MKIYCQRLPTENGTISCYTYTFVNALVPHTDQEALSTIKFPSETTENLPVVCLVLEGNTHAVDPTLRSMHGLLRDFPWQVRSFIPGAKYEADIYVAQPNRPLQVVSYDAPEVVVWPKEDSDKFDPTSKLVLYGGVVDASSAYELLWTQVMWAQSGVIHLASVGDNVA